MTIKKTILLSLFFPFNWLLAQNFSGVYKIDQLLKRIENTDTTFVVNFWATWCKPCVQELPAFDSLNFESKGTRVKVILVSLDFKEELEKKVKPFLATKHIQSECVLLDEVNGNDFVDKISSEWSGAIPATLFKHSTTLKFRESKITLSQLHSELKELQ